MLAEYESIKRMRNRLVEDIERDSPRLTKVLGEGHLVTVIPKVNLTVPARNYVGYRKFSGPAIIIDFTSKQIERLDNLEVYTQWLIDNLHPGIEIGPSNQYN